MKFIKSINDFENTKELDTGKIIYSQNAVCNLKLLVKKYVITTKIQTCFNSFCLLYPFFQIFNNSKSFKSFYCFNSSTKH